VQQSTKHRGRQELTFALLSPFAHFTEKSRFAPSVVCR
jgi:hypothetical protein